MKITSLVSLLVVSLVLSGTAVGCKKKLQKTTPLPGATGRVGDADTAGPIGDVPPVTADTGGGVGATDSTGSLPLSSADRSNWAQDRSTFAQDIVYFDFDKSNIKPGEVPKIEAVAAAFKGMAGKALRIEGHCDERGTTEYNRALGERRALSIREYLVRLGIDAALVETVSFGEDQPTDPGHTEAAWAKNRRGEFIVLAPPGQ